MKKLDQVKLTVLCDNVVGIIGGIGEHGYAIFIETEKGAYLFDTGSGVGILPNARLLKKDLRSVKKIFLSHGHYDHTGGLLGVLEAINPVAVYAHPAIFDEKYNTSKEGATVKNKFIGMPQRRSLLESTGALFQLGKNFREVEEGIFLTGEIPRITEFEVENTRLSTRHDNTFKTDMLLDDQALVISTTKGLIVLLGCAHAGTINTLQFVQTKLPKEPLYAVIGGTHWGFMDERNLESSIDMFKKMDIGAIGLSHCTGIPVAHRLMNEFGDRSFYASVGTVFETA